MEAILRASHEQEEKVFRFQAGLKGIKLDDGKPDRVEEAKRRANAILQGRDPDAEDAEQASEADDMAEFGIEYETD